MDEHNTHDPGAESAHDRRQWTRVYAGLDARVESAGLIVRGRVRDLSLTGVYLLCDPPFPKGTACRVTLVLIGAEPALTVDLSGTVVHAEDQGMGIEFTEMPVDSVGHLRNLVLYNAGDSDRIEDELHRPPSRARRPPGTDPG